MLGSNTVTIPIVGYSDGVSNEHFGLGKNVDRITEARNVRASKSARARAGCHRGGLSGSGMQGAQSARPSFLAIEFSAKGIAKKEISVLGTGDNLVAR